MSPKLKALKIFCNIKLIILGRNQAFESGEAKRSGGQNLNVFKVKTLKYFCNIKLIIFGSNTVQIYIKIDYINVYDYCIDIAKVQSKI